MRTTLALVGLVTACTGEPDVSVTEAPVITPARDLSRTAAASQLAFNFGKNIAVDGRGQLHVVWTEGSATAASIAYQRSTDGGDTWTPTLRFAASAMTGGPRVAAAGDDVYLTWHDQHEGFPRIYLQHSSNGGATFAAPVAISDANIAAAFPSIAAWGPEVHVVWGDARSGHSEIYIRNSVDHGARFGATVQVSASDQRSSWTPAVAAQGGVVHVAWTDERFDTADCADGGDAAACHEEEFYRRSTDAGAHWDSEVRLTRDAGAPKASFAPSIVVSGSRVHVAYFDFRTGVARIYYQRSTDSGATWPAQASGEQLISDATDAQPSARPVLAALGDAVRIVYWRGPEAGAPADVYFTASSTGGAPGSWLVPFALTSNIGHTSFSALQPSIALQSNGANHVIWMDNRDGNTEIYYQRLN